MLAVLIVVLLIAALAAGAQLALVAVAQRRVAASLTARGGAADVRIRAVPATRLLRERGDELQVRGSGVSIELADPGSRAARLGVGALDGFGDVDIELTDLRAGPFAIAAFVLTREGGGSYAMASEGTISAAGLAELGSGVLGSVPGGGLIGAVAGSGPIGSRRVSVSVAVELASVGGELQLVGGGGSVAGYPVGPLAASIAASVARRLEILP